MEPSEGEIVSVWNEAPGYEQFFNHLSQENKELKESSVPSEHLILATLGYLTLQDWVAFILMLASGHGKQCYYQSVLNHHMLSFCFKSPLFECFCSMCPLYFFFLQNLILIPFGQYVNVGHNYEYKILQGTYQSSFNNIFQEKFICKLSCEFI